jgi:hypothetical protein
MRRHAGFAARPAVPGDPPESSPRGADRSESAAPRQAVWMRLLAAGIAFGIVLLAGCERPDSVQWGHRGSSMIQLFTPSGVRALADINAIPEPEPDDPYDPTFPMATEIHENVQVLTDLNALELARLMNAMVTWIAPEEGCAYCHNPENLADDSKYTKHVSRQMLKMTRDINANWTSHVAETGVTCWTCHRGQPVPTDTWFTAPEPKRPSAHTTGAKAGQNTAGIRNNGNTSLPFDPLTAFLTDDTEIGVQGSQALPHGNRQSTKQTEWTYALMMYMSNSLGVNCTYCHNTRAMGEWDQSTPQRVTAWHGIRMVRDMNQEHLKPLLPLYPEHRLGPTGDAPKAACATCHKGTYKPLYGESMLADYPALQGVLPGRFSPDPTEGGLIRISTAPEGATIATMEERTRMAEAMLAAAAGGPATVAATARARGSRGGRRRRGASRRRDARPSRRRHGSRRGRGQRRRGRDGAERAHARSRAKDPRQGHGSGRAAPARPARTPRPGAHRAQPAACGGPQTARPSAGRARPRRRRARPSRPLGQRRRDERPKRRPAHGAAGRRRRECR